MATVKSSVAAMATTAKTAPAGNVKQMKTVKAVVEEGEEGVKQGRAIVLPNGQFRAEYIRNRFAEGTKRGDIQREVNEMLEAAGRGEEKIAYQIVFAATKAPKPKAEAE